MVHNRIDSTENLSSHYHSINTEYAHISPFNVNTYLLGQFLICLRIYIDIQIDNKWIGNYALNQEFTSSELMSSNFLKKKSYN